MSFIAVALILMTIGWIVTDSDGKIGNTQVTDGGGKGKEAAKIVFGGIGFAIFVILVFILILAS